MGPCCPGPASPRSPPCCSCGPKLGPAKRRATAIVHSLPLNWCHSPGVSPQGGVSSKQYEEAFACSSSLRRCATAAKRGSHQDWAAGHTILHVWRRHRLVLPSRSGWVGDPLPADSNDRSPSRPERQKSSCRHIRPTTFKQASVCEKAPIPARIPSAQEADAPAHRCSAVTDHGRQITVLRPSSGQVRQRCP